MRVVLAGLASLILVITMVSGCTDKDRVPSGIIEPMEMEKILWDMIQADQYAVNFIKKDSAHVDVKMETLKLYQEVFRLHKVSREEFRDSYKYYQGRPDLSRVMMDSVLTRGNRARTESFSRPPAAAPAPPLPGAAAGTSATPGGNVPKTNNVPKTIPGAMLHQPPPGQVTGAGHGNPVKPGGKPLIPPPHGQRYLPPRDSSRAGKGANNPIGPARKDKALPVE